MRSVDKITQERVKQVFSYDEKTGDLFWRVNKSSCVRVGRKAGSVNARGHVNVHLDGIMCAAHQLVYLMFHGHVPKEIDHINRVKTDNRIENLRECTSTGNKGNIGLLSNNKSGFRGVSFNNRSQMWHAQIKIKGKQTYLGRYDDPKEAALVYNEAAKKHFGEFAWLNEVNDANP